MFVTIGIYWVILEVLASGSPPRPLGLLKTGLNAIALTLGGVVLYLRPVRIPDWLSTGGPSEMSAAPAKLQVSSICFALAEAVALLGFVLRMLGYTRAGVAPFFLGVVALLVLCYPRLPSEDNR